MTRAGEFAWFTGLALALHLGLWIGVARSGLEAAGSGGQSTVSLMAASGRMADLVKRWARPVDAAQTLPTLPIPTAPSAGQLVDLPPAHPQQPPSVQPSEQVAPASATPERPGALPQIDTNSALPSLPRFAPESSLRPLSRPVHPAPAAQPRPAPPKPRAAPRPQSSGAMAQTAAGSGGGSNAGNKSTQRPATLSKAARQSLLARWGAAIRNRVERRKSYPGGTRASGTVVLQVTISRNGRLVAVSAVRSSGSAALDGAAVKAVRRARFPAAPKGLDAAQYRFNLPLAFTPK